MVSPVSPEGAASPGSNLDARDVSAIDAAKLYYLGEMSQAEVAAKLGVSRPTVSKLLTHARESGFVTISLHDPREQASELIGKLKQAFGLQEVHVVRPPGDDMLLKELGRAGAQLLERLVGDDASLGVSWGETMAAVADHLRPQPRVGVQVVQLKGGHSHSERSTKDIETLSGFANAFDAKMRLLPLPVIFDSTEAKEWVVQDRHIAHMLELGATVDIAAFTVGSATRESLALNLGYLTPGETNTLLERAVGDVCSRFFASDGSPACPSIDARTVGITLEDLAARPVRVLIAGGAAKADAIRTALTMNLATHLVIDHETAQRVMSS